MILALAIAVVLAAIAAPLTGSGRRDLMNASLQLRSDIRYVQRMCVLDGMAYRVEFINKTQYFVRRSGASPKLLKTVTLPNGVSCANMKLPTVVYTARGTVRANGRENEYSLDGYGPQTITLHNKAYRQNITIVPSSGRPAIYDIEKK